MKFNTCVDGKSIYGLQVVFDFARNSLKNVFRFCGRLHDVLKKVVAASISYQSKRPKSRRFIDVFGVCFCRLGDKTLSLQEPEGKI